MILEYRIQETEFRQQSQDRRLKKNPVHPVILSGQMKKQTQLTGPWPEIRNPKHEILNHEKTNQILFIRVHLRL